jgi:nicotinate-nucleotide adenylyltransferase
MAADLPPITPVPLPPGVREVLVFGGTFDPPHEAHASLPRKVRDQMLAPGAWVLYVPAARNPLKKHNPEASDQDRVNMLALLIAEAGVLDRAGDFGIWTDETDRARIIGGPTFTIDTIDRLRTALGPTVDIRLLIGSDQAADFHRWRSFRILFEQTRPIVMLRAPTSTRAALEQALVAAGAWSADDIKAWIERVAPTQLLGAGSTWVRALLKAPERNDALVRDVLTPSVYDYIQKNGLYR